MKNRKNKKNKNKKRLRVNLIIRKSSNITISSMISS